MSVLSALSKPSHTVTLRFEDNKETFGNEESSAHQSGFSFFPYVDNGGTVLGIAGDDFAICVADTRLSTGYRIHSRYYQKFTPLTSTCLIASSGMQADINTLHKLLRYHVGMYRFQHHRPPTIEALAQLLSTTLYHRRFFPFYAFNALIGLDKDGKGAIFDYDAIGSFQRSGYTARGSGSQLATSILDNQLAKENQLIPSPDLGKSELLDLAKDVITSVAERDIYTGDSASVILIDALGIHTSTIQLKKH